jgi:hypothetical protein
MKLGRRYHGCNNDYPALRWRLGATLDRKRISSSAGEMRDLLHLTSGDCAGENLAKCGLPGEVFVWHDLLYEGPRIPGWPDEETLQARAVFLEATTAGGLDRRTILETLRAQYAKLKEAAADVAFVLWFDACLFDQSMLVHILACLRWQAAPRVELLSINEFPGIEPFNGLGQLQPEQMASLYDRRQPVSDAQFEFAVRADEAFANQDLDAFVALSQAAAPPLPWIPAAVSRWLQEHPDPATGLGRLEALVLTAIRSGCHTPAEIFAWVAAVDSTPQYWGDTTLWAKINALAEKNPPLVKIEGPGDRLPQWVSELSLDRFKIKALPDARLSAASESRR